MTNEAMAATEKCGALQQRHIPCDGWKALVSKPLFGRKLGPALGKMASRQGKPILANICRRPHRSHCPHYPQSRASIVLIFLHCGKIAPLGLLCTSAKQPFGSGFIVVQFLYQGGTEMASALFAVEKNGRGRSSRKGPICANLVCRHGTRVRPKTNSQFGGAGTLRHQCANLYSVC